MRFRPIRVPFLLILSAVAPRAAFAQEVQASGVSVPARVATVEHVDEPWIKRHRPLPLAVELGVFAGAVTPSKRLGLVDDARLTANDTPYRDHHLHIGGELGGRAAFYPLSFLGAEAEGAIDVSKTNTDHRAAKLWSARGHLIAQLPFWRIVPFVLGGVNATGVASPVLGHESHLGGHYGGGLKLAVSEQFSLRVDARDTVLPRYVGSGVSHTGQYLFGLSYTLGRTSFSPYVAPADRDGDGVPDAADACPEMAGSLPNGCPPPPPDADGDGIPDARDACPAEAEDGAAPDAADGCPNKDQDGDGIALPADVCPAEKGVAPDGCAPKDSDGDGLLDSADRCPTAPETTNGFEDSDGCPDELPATVAKFSGVIKGILFENGKSDVKKSSTALLDEAASALAEYPALRVRIAGHTDDRGQREFNVKLSQARADSVKAYIVSKGIDASRIEAQGVGPDAPIADNKTSKGRAENRRIEFTLVQ